MVAYLISRLVVLVFGTLYPAYYSYKAVKTRNVKEYVKWMMYWIVFALFSCVETVADIFASILPFYYEVKILFIFWLISPWTKGSTYLYRKCIHPTLSKKEQEIDEYINQASTRGYEALKRVGRNGMTLAANAVMTSAIKGNSSLLDQLKTYSGIAAIAAGSAGVPEDKQEDIRKHSLEGSDRPRDDLTKLKAARDETDDVGSLLTPDLHDLDYGESTRGDLLHSLDRLDNRLREEHEAEQRQYIEGGEWGRKDIGQFQRDYQPDNDHDHEWGEVDLGDKDLDYILGEEYHTAPQAKPRAKPRSSPRRNTTQATMTTSMQQPHPPMDVDSESSDMERPPSLRRSTSLRSSTRPSSRHASTENLATTTSRGGRYASTENLSQRQMTRRQEALARSLRHSTRQTSKRTTGQRRSSDQLT